MLCIDWDASEGRLVPTRHRPFLAADNSRSTSPLLIPEAEDRHDARHLLIPGERAIPRHPLPRYAPAAARAGRQAARLTESSKNVTKMLAVDWLRMDAVD